MISRPPLELHSTLGPASMEEAVLRPLLDLVQACRINLSHASGEELQAWIERTRAADVRARIGADIRGRKLRIGPLPGGSVSLCPGEPFELIPAAEDAELPGSARSASVNLPALANVARPGDRALLSDGALSLRVRASGDRVICDVEIGGELRERSGFNLPGRRIEAPALTCKDLRDLDLIAELGDQGPDFLYLSYVEEASDVGLLRAALEERALALPIVSKIERAAALEELDRIAASSDALCLARGDLGVEVAQARLPAVQREVAAAARRTGKPLLLAGEISLALVERARPSRAELTDLAVAVEQGVAGFVLSDETAIGRDPVNAARSIAQLATELAATNS